MPIDVKVPRSPGWWMQRLTNRLVNPRRRDRLQLLLDYHRGHAPLPQGAENAREAFAAFQKKARSNFAELVTSAVSERMTPVGFRTAVDDDATGDAEVGQLWNQTGLDVLSADVHDLMLAASETYVIVGAVDEDTGAPIVTSEDPRWMVGEVDPANPRKLVAALKMLRDDVAGEDRVYLYLPGEVWVATKKSRPSDAMSWLSQPSTGIEVPAPRLPFDGRSWEIDAERSGPLAHGRIPVVLFKNKYGLGEFEPHLDLLDRINHQILQRMVIATMQAFRQRAVKGLPSVYPAGHPRAGQDIDYDDIFTSDPAAMWHLPKDAEMWESAVNDLTPILSAVRDDLQHLAAVTRTPMHMLSPGGENQSAEGASLSREGLVFKVKDRIARTSHPWAQVMSLVLLHAGQPERAKLEKLRVIWAPAEHLSLMERADAASKVKDILPRRTLLIDVLAKDPDEADRIMTEIVDDQLFAAELQQTLIAAGGQPEQPVQAANQQGQPQPNTQGQQRALPAGNTPNASGGNGSVS